MHITNGNYPVGNTAIPLADPNWDSNTSQGKRARNHLTVCLTAGMRRCWSKQVNYK